MSPDFLQQYEFIVEAAVRNVPSEFRDDAHQSGYLGLLNGLKNKHRATININGYLYKCVLSQIIRDIGQLYRPFSLNKNIYNELLKYKKMKRLGIDDSINCGMEKIISTRQISIHETE